MDLATAENHRSRLQREIDALSNCPAALSNARKFLAMEVERLNQQIASASVMSSVADGSEVTFAVENDMMMAQVSRDFGFTSTDISALEILQTQLVFEVPAIEAFHQPLPLACQLTQRVIELLEEEIQRQQKSPRSGSSTPRSGSSTPRSRFYYEELNKAIEDAIKAVIERGQAGARSFQVLEILKENSNVVMDDYVERTVRQKFFEATFALNSKPAPGE